MKLKMKILDLFIFLINFTVFLPADMKNVCVGWSCDTGGPTIWHCLSISKLRLGHRDFSLSATLSSSENNYK